jgi:hypothetical protein
MFLQNVDSTYDSKQRQNTNVILAAVTTSDLTSIHIFRSIRVSKVCLKYSFLIIIIILKNVFS